VIQVRIDLCLRCQDKLRAVLREKGQAAMIEAVGRVLCTSCRSKIPGYEPSLRLVTKPKEKAS
jgi:hypothetical protein